MRRVQDRGSGMLQCLSREPALFAEFLHTELVDAFGPSARIFWANYGDEVEKDHRFLGHVTSPLKLSPVPAVQKDRRGIFQVPDCIGKLEGAGTFCPTRNSV